MKRFGGLLILLAVIAIATIFYLRQRNVSNVPGQGAESPAMVTDATGSGANDSIIHLKGLIGGEKTGLLKDPEVIKILREKYHLEVDSDKRGSLAMVQEDQPADRDFLWPSSQVALDIYRESKKPMVRSEILLNSPIVLYSWESVTEALLRKGIVQKKNNTYYVVDFARLVQSINKGVTWKDMGLPQLYGRVIVYSTDPTQSNSGNMFAGLIANTLNNGNVATEDSLQQSLPSLKKFFDDQGYMDSSSETIFRQFLAKGIGDKPLIVGYESQIIEYGIDSASDPKMESRKKEVRLLYPQPTVWSSHPLIALTDNGAKLIDALQDPQIQQLAWTKHGFRSAVGADNNVKSLSVTGIPSVIENVIPMPRSKVMEKILEGLK
jgi:hypothetical protein